ncbi:hypothetical protein [Chitinophaga sp. OAE865]
MARSPEHNTCCNDKSIEIITTPRQNDAEDAAGVINIIIKKGK